MKKLCNARFTLWLLAVIILSMGNCFSYSLSETNNNNCAYNKLDSTKKLEAAASTAVRALEGYSNFAVNLFKDVIEDDKFGNVFISPLSVWSSLTATYLGSNNQTATELWRALGLEQMNRAEIGDAYQILKIWYYLRTKGKSEEMYVFRMANKLFFQEGEQIKDCILNLLGTEIMMVDYASDPEAARTDINQWVKQQTGDKIDNIIPQGYIDRVTKLVLVNAAYFKGTWDKQFHRLTTQTQPFYVRPNQPVDVSMMHQADVFNVARSFELNCSVVELPYKGNEISMFIFLPDVGNTKFELEQTSDLCQSLRHMGINDLFSPIKADLTGFTGKREFSVSKVSHKVFVNINEKGTEAAAATSLVSLRSGILPEEFKINRPFVFAIRDNVLDAILFVGLVRTPK